jgi:ABC-2 type transport system ATP-binding protein
VAEALALVELTEARRRLAGELSGGMRRRLALAGALVHGPALLFADEPTASLDPMLRRKLWDFFGHLREAGTTLVVTTQYVGEAAECDPVGVQRGGRLLVVDTPAGLRRRALAGEVIRLLVDPRHAYRAASALERLERVRLVRLDPRRPGQLYAHVEDAAGTLPEVVEAVGALEGVELQEAGDYQPPFDDVLVQLIEQLDPAGG